MHITSVSLVIPVYNVAPYVEDCIRSVMRQTYDGKVECIVVDDCGTDGSIQTVKKLISEYNGPIAFQILHHTHNRGLSAARNTGIDAAKGDYLFFLDSDDELTDDCLEQLAKPLETEWYDIIVGAIKSRTNVRLFSGLELKLADRAVLRDTEILNTYRTEWNMMVTNKLYRSQFVKHAQLKFHEGLIHEDELWSFQVASLASSLCSVQHVTYLYRIRQGSLATSSIGHEKANNYSIIIRECAQFAKDRGARNEHVCLILNDLFSLVLRCESSSFSQYKKRYLELVPVVKPPLKFLFHRSFFHITNFHFFLPTLIAPWWQLHLQCILKRIK